MHLRVKALLNINISHFKHIFHLVDAYRLDELSGSVQKNKNSSLIFNQNLFKVVKVVPNTNHW
jgi:hypothetical protein